MPEIMVRGENVHFQDTIRQERHAIVFLHGAGGSHHTWRDQWAGLKGCARLVIPDLPGHAESGGEALASIDRYAAWLSDFVGETGLTRYILAGHSMGGAIAQQAAINGLKGIEAVVLVCTGAKLRVSPVIFDGIGSRFPEFAPELVGMNVADGAIKGQSFRTIRLEFSEAMDLSTITGAAISLASSKARKKLTPATPVASPTFRNRATPSTMQSGLLKNLQKR